MIILIYFYVHATHHWDYVGKKKKNQSTRLPIRRSSRYVFDSAYVNFFTEPTMPYPRTVPCWHGKTISVKI